MEQPDLPSPGPGNTFTLSLRADTIQTEANNAIFNAPLVSQVATLQTGDSITDTGTGGILNAVFNPVALNLIGAAIHGVSTWNLTNVGTWGAPQWITGGSLVTGVVTLNAINSNAPLVVGVTGAALSRALTTVTLRNTMSVDRCYCSVSSIGQRQRIGSEFARCGDERYPQCFNGRPRQQC